MFKLAENKHKLHKSSTVLLSIFLAILSILEIVNQYLPMLSAVVSASVFPYISFGIAVAIAVGRYVLQTSLRDVVEEVKEEGNADPTN